MNLWTFVPRLNFDASASFIRAADEVCKAYEEDRANHRAECQEMNVMHCMAIGRERLNFIKWTNQSLQSHQALVLDGFRVCCDLDVSFQAQIDNWVHAFSRGETWVVDWAEEINPGITRAGFVRCFADKGVTQLGGVSSEAGMGNGYCRIGGQQMNVEVFKVVRSPLSSQSDKS
ncbi:OLC1v1006746C1 [Oldenlandia corymbosa var. corymbosa]|uniref:OLC1v1006746C1 n=1 Tax=Oldenlandia corymbosa var. corymbosa TaxID=529605 RepID=A0AAV1DJ80_OLDCO|nr:OLC1v1006746C1 [Oldenlandia corymbosa var. corymbosa]